MQRSECHGQQPPDPRDVLRDLVRRVDCLRPDHRNPHRFHEEKSEIAHELRKLAGRVF